MYTNIPHIRCNYHQKMMTHHSVMTSSLRIKNVKIDKFGDFSCDIDYSSRTDVFRDVFPIYLINVIPGARRAPLADTKCPLAAQRKQAKRACVLVITVETGFFLHRFILTNLSCRYYLILQQVFY